MKKLLCTMVCIQMASAPTITRAASLDDGAAHATIARTGAFAGARLKLKLGGRERDRTRIGLALAPVRAAQRQNGALSLGISDGVELGFSSTKAPGLKIAGQPVERRFGASEGRHGGVPTWVLITGGVAVVLAIGAALFIDRLEDSSD